MIITCYSSKIEASYTLCSSGLCRGVQTCAKKGLRLASSDDSYIGFLLPLLH